MHNNYVLLKRNCRNAVKMPEKQHLNDAGYDLTYIGKNRVIWPHQILDLETGWDVKIPYGYWGGIKSRSSTFARLKLLVLEGVIDANYTGNLSVLVFNPTLFPRRIKKGMRLAQLILMPSINCKFMTTEKMPNTVRNSKGFGSTGE